MKTKAVVVLLAVAFLLVCASNLLYAEDGRFALSAKAGTLGLGLEAAASINTHFDARVGVNAFIRGYSGTESDIKYDIDLTLLSFAGLIDWYPTQAGFRLTGGVLLNKNSLDLKATSSASYDIGGTTYTAAEVGTLKGELDFKDLAPYAGIGWGKHFGRKSSWSLNFDLGVMFQGSPKLDYTTDGTLSSNAAFRADLDREMQDAKDELDKFKYYPVVSVGVTYRF